jgi:hypothetical protein
MQKTLTITGIISYPIGLFEPKPYKDKNGKEKGEPNYAAELLIEKDSQEFKNLEAFLANSLEQAGKTKKDIEHYPVLDGDKNENENYKNKWVLRMKRKESFGPVDMVKQDAETSIQSKSELQGGDLVRVYITGYVSENAITAQLHCLQLLKTTKNPFSGVARNAKHVFEPYADDSYLADQNNDIFA